MLIIIPQITVTKPALAEVRYVTETTQLIAKSGPKAQPAVSQGAGLESNFKPYKLSVIDGKKLPLSPLKSMKLPGTWWRYSPMALAQPDGYKYNFSPRGDRDTIISLYRDGFVIDVPAYEQLSKTLEAAPHNIGEEEARALPELYTKYKYLYLRTEDWNGKRVIVGETFMGDHTPVYELIYDSYPPCNGRAAICFYAPPNKYKKYIKAVKACFKTIEWETIANKSHQLSPAP